MKKILALVVIMAVGTAMAAQAADADLEKKIKDLEKRLRLVERKAATDRVDFTGDFRFEAHNIDADIPDYMDGMALQNVMAQTLFYFGANGTLPMASPTAMDFAALGTYVMQNGGNYMAYANSLTFAGLRGGLQDLLTAMAVMNGMDPATLTPEQWAGLQDGAMQLMLAAPGVMQGGYDWKNDILYTSRLRLNMNAKVADDVSFAGRLSMYKPWGDSTGLQVFNGQSNSLNIDGNTTRVPNSDILRVDRAYFNWNRIGDSSLYLSIGRRPSTGGPPLHLREDEMRGGTPLGSVVDFQFDGITAGFDVHENSKLRLCYGLGYESGFGSAENLRRPADRLKDAHFFGFNWDVWSKGENFVQATVLRAFDATDGFNGVVVLPDNPVSGDAIGAPMVMRFTPSTNLGDIDLASLLVMREWRGFDFFASYSVMKSHPELVTTPFGGLFCDPFETPEEQTGKMAYAGARYSFADEKTKVGLEYNKGSKYWFNFSQGADDIVAPKTGTRGEVWEAYLTHRVDKRFIVKLDYMHYAYDYSGSGWHLGAPKDLNDTPILGYPTYSAVNQISLSTSVRF
ncbi:DUF3373 domain-containing protein [bacterium]|nr:DUF3373 domain-containing protein [bacterium]MBU1675433.1 DUF3373 domain-containing protein [bacterium]